MLSRSGDDETIDQARKPTTTATHISRLRLLSSAICLPIQTSGSDLICTVADSIDPGPSNSVTMYRQQLKHATAGLQALPTAILFSSPSN